MKRPVKPRRHTAAFALALVLAPLVAVAAGAAAHARRQQNGPPPTPLVQGALIEKAEVGTGYDEAKGAVTGAGSVFPGREQVIHLGVRLKKPRTGAKVRGVLTAVDAGGVKGYKIVEQTLAAAAVNSVHFRFSLPRPWPVGLYRVDLFLDGKKELSLPYRVKG